MPVNFTYSLTSWIVRLSQFLYVCQSDTFVIAYHIHNIMHALTFRHPKYLSLTTNDAMQMIKYDVLFLFDIIVLFISA